MQIIAIDNGRNMLKAVSGDKRLEIPSVVGEWRKRKVSTGGDYEVAIDGKKWFVGNLAKSESRFKREKVKPSKIHEDTKILTLTAIALLSEPGQKLKIITGLPVDDHTPETKEQYKKLLGGNHDVEVNGNKYKIAVDDEMLITIEGAGAYFSEMANRGKCRVLDIGSRTVNCLTIDNGILIDKDSFTLPYGCLELLNAEDDPNANEQLAEKIAADLSRRWMDYNNEKVLIAGGGAIILSDWLLHHYPLSIVASEPVFANVLGFYKMGKSKWQGK